jgi:hypothetical protein
VILLLSLAFAGTPVTIGLVGASGAVGTDPAYTGTTINSGDVYYISNVLQTTIPHPNTGAQDGLLDCLDAEGYDTTLFQRASAGQPASWLQSTAIPNLIADADNRSETLDAIVIIHGGTDAESQANASAYKDRVFGPWFVTGSGSADESVLGLLRTEYPDLPAVVTTLHNWNGEDLLSGLPEDSDKYWHQLIRGSQYLGCYRDPFCSLVGTDTTSLTLAADGHPESESYYDWGWRICQALVLYSL